MTFPKLPLPMTLRRSNASMVSGSPLTGLKSIFKWNEPEPAVALYHWSEACYQREQQMNQDTTIKHLCENDSHALRAWAWDLHGPLGDHYPYRLDFELQLQYASKRKLKYSMYVRHHLKIKMKDMNISIFREWLTSLRDNSRLGLTDRRP